MVSARVHEFRVPSELEALRPVLGEWASVYSQAALTFRQSNKFWFNERSLVALLSASSWRAGIPSIAEFKTSKQGEANWTGHADLALQLGDIRLVIEAKRCWLEGVRDASNSLRFLEAARSEACRLTQFEGAMCLGALFAMVNCPDGSPREEIMVELRDTYLASGVDLVAWSAMKLIPSGVHSTGCILLANLPIASANPNE